MTFLTAPARTVPTANTTTVTTDAQLDAEIAARVADGASKNVLLDGAFREVYINGYSRSDAGDGLQLWLLAGSSITYAGTNPGGGDSIFRFRSCDYAGIHAATGATRPEVDGASTGNNGAIWGVVIGQSYLGDTRAGACTNITVEGLDVHHVQQETMKVSATGTADVEILDNEIRDAGLDTTVNDVGELVYVAEGSGGAAGTQDVDNVLIRWNNIHTNREGEGVDIKRGASNVKIWDNDISNLRMRFGGAITFWSDDLDPGFDANGSILRNRVFDAHPGPGAFTSSIEAIEIGGDAVIERNIMWDFSGRGINLVSQFAGSNKIVNAHFNIIDATNGGNVFELNTEAPNGGSNPGALIASNNAYLSNLSGGSNGAGGSLTNNILIDATDVDGPITTGTADSGNGPGSGYFPDSAGSQVDAGNSYALSVDLDAYGTAGAVNGTRDVGAFEYGATVDTTPPASTITSPADAATVTTDSVTITGTSTDAGSGVASVELRIGRITGGLYWNGTTYQSGSVFVPAVGTTSWSYTADIAVDDGDYQIEVRATDVDGNVEQTPFDIVTITRTSVDTTDPDAVWIYPPNSSTQVTAGDLVTLEVDATDNAGGSGVALVRFRVIRQPDGLWWDGSTWVTGPIYLTATNTSGDRYEYADVPFATAGAYTLGVIVDDTAGNIKTASEGTATSYTITVDPPSQFDIDSPTAGTLIDPNGYTFAGTIDPGTPEVRVRIKNVADGTVRRHSDGLFVADTGSNETQIATLNVPAEAWLYGPIDLPPGIPTPNLVVEASID